MNVLAIKKAAVLGVAIGLATLAGCRKSAPSSSEPNAVAPSAVEAATPAENSATPVPPEAPPIVAAPPTPVMDGSAVSPSHQFYGVYLSGQKAGWAEERVTVGANGEITLAMRVELRISRLGQTMNLSIADEVRYAALPSGAMVAFALTETQPGGATAVREGAVKDGKFEVSVTAAGATSKQTFDSPPKETAADTLPALMIPRLRSAPDGRLVMWQYDRQNFRDIPVKTRLVSEKKTRIQGVPTSVLEVEGIDEVRGITMNNRLSDTGLTLEMALGPGLKLVLEDRAMAKNPAVSVPDLYRLSVVRLDKRLGTPSMIDRLRVRLTGLPKTLTLDDGRQTRKGDVIEVTRRALGDLPKSTLTAVERKRWLASTPFIDHDSTVIAGLLRQVPKGTDGARVASMTRLVNRSLRYTLATAPLTASEILKGGRGDCTEYARLMTALARAAGLPAREVSGMAYAGDSDPGFAFHAWTEVYVDGRWMAADPTWNQTPPDATHIALSRDDPTAIVGVMGGLKAEVLDVKRR